MPDLSVSEHFLTISQRSQRLEVGETPRWFMEQKDSALQSQGRNGIQKDKDLPTGARANPETLTKYKL